MADLLPPILLHLLAALLALWGLIARVRRPARAGRRPVPVSIRARYAFPLWVDKLPDVSGIGTRFTTRGPPAPHPLRPDDDPGRCAP